MHILVKGYDNKKLNLSPMLFVISDFILFHQIKKKKIASYGTIVLLSVFHFYILVTQKGLYNTWQPG